MTYFPKTERWFLPHDTLALCREEMAIDGRLGDEGVCLFLGTKIESDATVTHVVRLRGSGVSKSPQNVTVSPELLRDVHEAADAENRILVGMIHSHSKLFGVDFSATDHAYGFRVPYFLSIVFPNYAQDTKTEISACGVHVFLPDAGYVRLSAPEVTKRVVTIAETKAKLITIGPNGR